MENTNSQPVTLRIVGNSESQGRYVASSPNNWAVEVFIASGDVNANTPIESTRTNATVPPDQAALGWEAGNTLTLEGITASLDLSGAGKCDSIDVLCTMLYQDPASGTSFSIEGDIVSCAPVVCIGKSC